MKKLLTFTLLLFCIALPTKAQTNVSDPNEETIKDSIGTSVSKDESKKKFKKVIIPTVTYNNSFGAIFGFMASGFYKLNGNDSISPESSSALIGAYSTNDTWYLVQANKFYFKEDKFRSKLVGGLGSVNFQTYLDWGDIIGSLPPNIIPIPPPGDGFFIDYNTRFQFIYLDFLVRTYKRLYLGGNLVYSHSLTEFDLPGNPKEDLDLFGFGFSSEYDTRDNQFMPLNGFNGKFNTMTFLESLGSSSNYTNINLEYNKYFPQGERNTILLRLYGQAAVGDVPFAGQNVVGRDDLRGYSNGKYRANQVYDIQSEYRHWFAKRWGYVAFGGVATAINDASDLSFDNLLPAVGGGIRFLAIPSSKISVGMDVAVGKDDWGLYFRIGEAFTR
ncbi:BamA/TamA family outer membrane protein [Lutimonas saemankumensis]|uniref:BamA/TamA family outer membrane protein n=1 Tax=Lutimonas saemankumensis TaxID=483016 RepID=UPI001CD2419F|nr:BamA/TamA family outer membrane protein [Lutimonas saemankumensis]MCA0931614.1 BamA/TamA family outer membrane protein [Lutimonas saemankumensis]